MHLDNTTLKNVFAELLEHLNLCGVYHIAKVHMILKVALESHFDRFRNRHRRFSSGQRECNCS